MQRPQQSLGLLNTLPNRHVSAVHRTLAHLFDTRPSRSYSDLGILGFGSPKVSSPALMIVKSSKSIIRRLLFFCLSSLAIIFFFLFFCLSSLAIIFLSRKPLVLHGFPTCVSHLSGTGTQSHGCGFSGSALFKAQDGNSAMQCSAVIQREVIDSAHRTQSIFFQLGMFRHVAPAELTKAPQVTTNSKVDNLFIVFCVKRECCMWSSSLCSLSITRVAAMITRHPFTFFHSFCLIYYDIIITTSKRTAYIYFYIFIIIS